MIQETWGNYDYKTMKYVYYTCLSTVTYETYEHNTIVISYNMKYNSFIFTYHRIIAYHPINNEMLNIIFLKCSIYVNVMIQIDSTTRIKLIYDNEYPFKAHFIAIM